MPPTGVATIAASDTPSVRVTLSTADLSSYQLGFTDGPRSIFDSISADTSTVTRTAGACLSIRPCH